MFRPDGLRSGCGKTDTVVDRPRVPRFADAKTNHVADTHVHHHLRRRHHHGAYVRKRVDATAGQPVIEPHRVRPGGKGVGKGVAARRALADQPFQPHEVGHPFLPQVAGERNRLAIAVEGHQVCHCVRLAGDPQFEAIQQAVENVCRIEFTGDQFVAHRRPAGFFGRYQGNAIFFIEPFQRRDRDRRAVRQRNKSDSYGRLLRLIGSCRPCALHHAGQQHRPAQRGACL